MFYPEGLVDFALEKSFIPKLPFFLLHRWVQKWLFAKYCPHLADSPFPLVGDVIYRRSLNCSKLFQKETFCLAGN